MHYCTLEGRHPPYRSTKVVTVALATFGGSSLEHSDFVAKLPAASHVSRERRELLPARSSRVTDSETRRVGVPATVLLSHLVVNPGRAV